MLVYSIQPLSTSQVQITVARILHYSILTLSLAHNGAMCVYDEFHLQSTQNNVCFYKNYLELTAQRKSLSRNAKLKRSSRHLFSYRSSTMTSLRDRYRDILALNGIHDHVKHVEICDSGAKGDRFASVIKRVKISFEDDTKPPWKLFIKTHTENPSQKQIISDIKAFEKESQFFMGYLLPAAKQLCADKGFPDLADFYPKCYFGNEELIVLEDLVEDRGFEMTPSSIKHDFNHTTLALNSLAKHHAISYAMIKETGGGEQYLDFDSFGTMLPSFDSFEDPFGSTIEILETNEVEGSAEALEFIKPFAERKYSDIIKDAWEFANPLETLALLNHGDYKHNNMMFWVDKETGALLGHIAIDLQVTRYDSPIWDIVFYLSSSVDNSVRQTRIQEFFTKYLETLNQLSKDLGHATNLTFEDLWGQYRKRFEISFWSAVVMVGPGMGILKTMDIEQHDFTQINGRILENCPEEMVKGEPRQK